MLCHRRAAASLICLFIGGCEPSDDGSGSGAAATTGDATTGTTGETGTGGESETEADTDGAAVDVGGVLLRDAAHNYQCIDGCEGFYSNDHLTLTIESAEAREVEVAWHDWTTTGRALDLYDDSVIDVVSLTASTPEKIELWLDHTGFCAFEEWSRPMTLLVTVDGVAAEIEGYSVAGYGWDC